MIDWLDPLIIGSLTALCLLTVKGVQVLRREVKRRRQLRIQTQRDVRLLASDYRAKYGTEEALERLQKDLEASRVRVEQLAVQWKACQMKAEEALGAQEVHSVEEEVRRAYQAFSAEARRHQQLKQTHEHLSR